MRRKWLVLTKITRGLLVFVGCAYASLATAIVGGEDVEPAQFPHFVGISVSQSPTSRGFCGGTFIDAEWVLTSAHCVSNNAMHQVVDASRVSVHPNPTGVFNGQIRSAVTLSVSQVVVHPDYNRTLSASTFHDIALLKLSSPHTYPVAILNNDNASLVNQEGIAVGIGSVSATQIVHPNRLQSVDLPIVSNAQCQQLFGFLSPPTLCAGHFNQAKDVCFGDLGAPLYVMNDNTTIQVGISSFVQGGCASGNPSGYTDVASYQSFIQQYATQAQWTNLNKAMPATLSSVSGAWYDRAFNGSGINIIQPDANRLILYYYGYKGAGSGLAQWLYAELNETLLNGRIVMNQPYTFTVYQGALNNGASFTKAPDNPPGIESWGSLTIQFNSCNQATMSVDGKDGIATFNLVKLANEYAIGCSYQ